jgi:hypothetical protein
MLQQDAAREFLPATVHKLLKRGGSQRYGFHQYERVTPPSLLLYRQHQKNALWHGCDRLVAGTDGSVHERAERLGAGKVLEDDLVPILNFVARVGGPLATIRAEAANLLQSLRDVLVNVSHHVILLIFVDCPVVLDILLKWGRDDLHPEPKEVVHFDVILPLLHELRQ